MRAVTFTPDGNILVGLGTLQGRSTLEFFGRDGISLQTLDIPQTARTFTDAGGSLGALDVDSAVVRSLLRGSDGLAIEVLLDDASEDTSPMLVAIDLEPNGSAAFTAATAFPVAILAAGQPQAAAS